MIKWIMRGILIAATIFLSVIGSATLLLVYAIAKIVADIEKEEMILEGGFTEMPLSKTDERVKGKDKEKV